MRAIIAATDGGKPFTVLEYKGESSVLRVGDTIRAGSRSYRLSRVKLDHLILRHLSGDIRAQFMADLRTIAHEFGLLLRRSLYIMTPYTTM